MQSDIALWLKTYSSSAFVPNPWTCHQLPRRQAATSPRYFTRNVPTLHFTKRKEHIGSGSNFPKSRSTYVIPVKQNDGAQWGRPTVNDTAEDAVRLSALGRNLQSDIIISKKRHTIKIIKAGVGRIQRMAQRTEFQAHGRWQMKGYVNRVGT